MSFLAVAVQLGAGAVLVAAAGAKLAAPRAFADTLAALGVSRPALVARLVPAVEVAAAVALAAAPAALASRVAVAAVGLAFALAGVWALVRGRTVECACFGGNRGAPLGARQLLLLPGWLAAAVLPAAWGTPLAGRDGALALAAVVVAVAAARSVPVLRSARDGRDLRAAVAR